MGHLEGEEGCEETTIRLDGLLTTLGNKLHYWYDFGENWHHTVLLEKTEPRSEGDDRATCVTGVRACPPEDIRGTYFYSELFDAVDDADHPEHQWAAEVMANLQLSREDAAAFDLAAHDAAVQRALAGGEALRAILGNVMPIPWRSGNCSTASTTTPHASSRASSTLHMWRSRSP